MKSSAVCYHIFTQVFMPGVYCICQSLTQTDCSQRVLIKRSSDYKLSSKSV